MKLEDVLSIQFAMACRIFDQTTGSVKDPEEALVRAVMCNRVDNVIPELFKLCSSSMRVRAFCVAARHGMVDVLRKFVELKLVCNVSDWEGLSVIHHAALSNDIACLNFVLECGGDTEDVDRGGNTPLDVALKEGCKKTAAELLRSGAKSKLDAQGRSPKSIITSDFSEESKITLLEKQLSENLNVLESADSRESLLHTACSNPKNRHVILFLLRHIQEVDVPNSDGYTPLQFYLKNGGRDPEVLRVMLQKRANPFLQGPDPVRPIFILATIASLQNSLNKPNPEYTLTMNKYEFSFIFKSENMEIEFFFKTLLACGLSARSFKGHDLDRVVGSTFPLLKLMMYPNAATKEMLQICKDLRVEDDIRTPSGKYPIHYAVIHGNVAAIEFLFDEWEQANNEATRSHETPLHFAFAGVEPIHLKMQDLLLSYGEAPTVSDNEGNAPVVDYAKRLVAMNQEIPNPLPWKKHSFILSGKGKDAFFEEVRKFNTHFVAIMIRLGLDESIKYDKRTNFSQFLQREFGCENLTSYLSAGSRLTNRGRGLLRKN